MKIYKLSGRNLSVANVGGFNSLNDKNRMYMVSDWLFSNDPEYSNDIVFKEDNIDLNVNRDFLKEANVYDLVILHDIYNQFEFRGQGIFSMSDGHNVANWLKRLVSTNADYIFVFGSWGEVGGWWLGNIPGYKKYEGKSEYQTVYRKESLLPIEVKEKKPIEWDKIDISWLNPSNTDPHSP